MYTAFAILTRNTPPIEQFSTKKNTVKNITVPKLSTNTAEIMVIASTVSKTDSITH